MLEDMMPPGKVNPSWNSLVKKNWADLAYEEEEEERLEILEILLEEKKPSACLLKEAVYPSSSSHKYNEKAKIISSLDPNLKKGKNGKTGNRETLVQRLLRHSKTGFGPVSKRPTLIR
jgi:hypothetical protein